MPTQDTPIAESILELHTQLEQFRSTHPRRTRLPVTLWQSAAELARQHGIYTVAHSLRLDYTTLKKHVNGSSAIYAKVDLVALRGLALPWLGGGQ